MSTVTVRSAEKKKRWRQYIPIYLMMLPGFVYLLFNNYIPIMGLIIAFKNINFRVGILRSEWVGLKNFEYLFKTSDAWIITRNTILYNVTFIILGIIVGVTIAILLNEIRNKFLLKTYQTVILLPHLISWVIISYFTYALLSIDTGMLNSRILPMFGIGEISWFTEPKYWPFILIIMNVWKTFGFNCIFYYTSIMGISAEYYEAAMIDGASKLKQIRYITLPLLKPTIITLFLLNVGRIFYADFGLFYQVPMNSGALFSVTDVIDTYVFRGMQLGDMGMTTAAGFYQSLVGFVLVVLSNTIVARTSKEYALY
jgi:putative aldouronate transport system permease protein